MIFTIISMILLLFSGIVNGQLLLNLNYNSGYNSNICSLGKGEIDEFKTSENAGEKYKLNTYDDWINSFGFRLDYIFKIRPYKFQLSFSPDYTLYLKNSIKNYPTIRTDFKVIRWFGSITSYYIYIPDYHYRTYFDEDSDKSQWCIYDYNEIGLQFRGIITKKLISDLILRYKIKYYTESFLEYDSHNPLINIALRYNFENFQPRFSIGYGILDAQGFDQIGESKNYSDETDISYKEFNIDTGFTIRNIVPFDIGADYSYRFIKYSSNKGPENDPIHWGRKDYNHQITPFITLKDYNNLRLKFACTLNIRESTSPVFKDIENLKNYFIYELYINMNYNLIK